MDTKKTLNEIITEYLKSERIKDPVSGWVVSWALTKANTPFGWVGTSGRRRCNELVKQGILEQRINGRYAEFRYKMKQESEPRGGSNRPRVSDADRRPGLKPIEFQEVLSGL